MQKDPLIHMSRLVPPTSSGTKSNAPSFSVHLSLQSLQALTALHEAIAKARPFLASVEEKRELLERMWHHINTELPKPDDEQTSF